MSHLAQSPKNLEFAKSRGSCCLSVNRNSMSHEKAEGMPLVWKAKRKGGFGIETYDLAASLATISDNDIDSCLGLFRMGAVGCWCLLPPSCEDGEGVGTKLNGLDSSFGIVRCSKECECAI